MFSQPIVLTPSEVLTSGCKHMDTFFNGGLKSGITEFVGCSGTGKSQLVLQLSITAQLPRELGGLDGKVLYISSGGSFSSSRLAQISHSFKTRYGNNLQHDPMNRIFVGRVYDMSTLVKILKTEVPIIIKKENIKLMIIDSIATPFRYDFQNDNQGLRNDTITLVGEQLTDLFTRYKLVIVCTNQFSWTRNYEDQVPSLNLRWSKWVDHRIIVSKDEGGVRTLSIGFSNSMTPRSLLFEVNMDGVHSPCSFKDSLHHDVKSQSTHRGLVPVQIGKIAKSNGSHIFLHMDKLFMIRIVGQVTNVTQEGLRWLFKLDDGTGVVECDSQERPTDMQYFRVIGHYQPLPPRVIVARMFQVLEIEELIVHLIETDKLI